MRLWGLPDGFELKSDQVAESNNLAQGWILAWAARLIKLGEPWLGKEAAFAELGIAEPETPVENVIEPWEEVPDDVMEWRPWTDTSGR
ncbi:hypothetical protein ACFQ68_33970 [Amycolatopsis japonica]|uniref:hypothetical protein n=1 Tax=Amycolatopsis japonica TaxID=208439 RepID=UPI00366C92E0